MQPLNLVRSIAVATLLAVAPWPGGGAAAQSTPLAGSETNIDGVTAEVTECRRKEGVLSIRLRLKNTGEKDVRVTLIGTRDYDKYYVTAENKKYFVLRDSEKVPLAPAADPGGAVYANIAKGGGYTWWAKYPAPPPTVKKVTYYTLIAPPIEDIPIQD